MADNRTDPADDGEALAGELRLTPEQALALAIERHKLDRLDDAQAIYTVLLESWPD